MRLIDADKLLEEFERSCSDGDWWFEDRVLEAPTVTVNSWISVKDRLPGDEKPVLAYYGFDRGDGEFHGCFIGVLTYFVFDKQPHFQHESTGLRVTHWMPLPSPPKSE